MGGGNRKSWKRRYFVFFDATLKYYTIDTTTPSAQKLTATQLTAKSKGKIQLATAYSVSKSNSPCDRESCTATKLCEVCEEMVEEGVIAEIEKKGVYGLKIHTPTRVWYLRLINKDRRDDWVRVIEPFCTAKAPTKPDQPGNQ